MKGTRFVNGFSKKNPRVGKKTILGPKMAHPHNPGIRCKNFVKILRNG